MSVASKATDSVIAFAGRRTDVADSLVVRFPFESVPTVQQALTALLSRERPIAVVASGACGSDLTMLQAADALEIRTRIVLPFAPEHFRRTSVIDRPHPEFWGSLFDGLVATAQSRGDLVILNASDDDTTAYAATNRAIIAEATTLAEGEIPRRRLAVIAWDGAVRGPTDATREFADLAVQSGFCVQSISTLGPADSGSGH
ncbi:hypothetical protein [Mesorhizobium sp. WSM2239]|uniref:Uncharacterized protein n=2 Tax=unclassified Mesorhizobium TaxID=325217 RepID=A0AAU8DGD1_9HYPH